MIPKFQDYLPTKDLNSGSEESGNGTETHQANYELHEFGSGVHKTTRLGCEHIEKSPSILFRLPPFEELPPPSPNSFTLHYKKGRALEEGTKLITGEAAKDRAGSEATYNAQKWEVIVPHLLARIHLKTGHHQIVDKLIFAVPPQQQCQFNEVSNLLIGTHLAEINGQDVELIIKDVEIGREGEAAMQAIREEGYLSPGTLNGIIDFGKVTVDMMLTDESDRVITDTVLTLNYGVRELLHRIANDPALIEVTGGLPDLDLIEQGIEKQIFSYGCSGANFEQTFRHYFSGWLRHPIQVARTRWEKYHARRDKTIVVGGIAPLIEPLLGRSSRWIVPFEPQTANLRGLIYKAKRELFS